MIEQTSLVADGALSLAADGATGGVNISSFAALPGSVAAVYTYGVGEDSAGTITLQASVDNVNFNDVPDTTVAFTSASVCDEWAMLSGWPSVYYRLSVNNTSGSGGTAAVTFNLKRELS